LHKPRSKRLFEHDWPKEVMWTCEIWNFCRVLGI
jgi:hypothetical protein